MIATTRFAAIQMCSTADVEANNRIIECFVREAAGLGAQVVSLPEAANILLKDNMRYAGACVSEKVDTTLALCRQLAAELEIWLHDGSLLIKTEDGKRIWNRTHVISPAGDVVAQYDKLHTFDVKLGDGHDFLESRAVQPGEGPPTIVDFAALGISLGLSICYDVRFAYLFRALAAAGANVLMIPASFSPVTGPAHWETLLRARAIETGSYVVAAAQCGTRDGVRTHGRSLIISPFGEVISSLGDEPGIIIADIDPAEIEATRRRLPCLTQDRELKPAVKVFASAGDRR